MNSKGLPPQEKGRGSGNIICLVHTGIKILLSMVSFLIYTKKFKLARSTSCLEIFFFCK